MTARILYVDDEPDIREVAEMSLQLDPDFEVMTCASGAEAVEVASEWTPDLILLDVMMPGMDGPATLAALRGNPRTSEVTVVFITARTQAADVSRLLEAGAAGVISKPFDPVQLSVEARRYLHRSANE